METSSYQHPIRSIIGRTIERVKKGGELKESERILIEALPGPQQEAIDCAADELFFGGQAGGGKSYLLLILATTQHHRSIIFRRTYPEFDEMQEQARLILAGTGAKENENLHIWRNIPGKRYLRFAAVPTIKDVKKYMGRPHDLVAFDELPNLLEKQYDFLRGWARTSIPNQRVRRVATGNPPTSDEGEWVIHRWGAWLDDQAIHKALPGELLWYAMIDDRDTLVEDGRPFQYKGEMITPLSRTFIPASIDDNPYYLQTGYKAQLQSLPEPLRSQLLYGDFKVGRSTNPWQVIPLEWIRAAQSRWKQIAPPLFGHSAYGVDVARGGKDKSVIALLSGTYFHALRRYEGSKTPNGQELAALILQNLGEDDRIPIFIDVIGVGASVYDILQLTTNLDVFGVNFAEGTQELDKSGKLRFINIRAEAYWRLREALDPSNGFNIALPDDEELTQELIAPHWTLTGRGIKVEPKDAIAARLGRSPDSADAVVMAWWGGNYAPTLDFDDSSDFADFLGSYRG